MHPKKIFQQNYLQRKKGGVAFLAPLLAAAAPVAAALAAPSLGHMGEKVKNLIFGEGMRKVGGKKIKKVNKKIGAAIIYQGPSGRVKRGGKKKNIKRGGVATETTVQSGPLP